MGIDLIAGGKSKRTKRTAPRSDDIYLKLIVKEFRWLSAVACQVSGDAADDQKLHLHNALQFVPQEPEPSSSSLQRKTHSLNWKQIQSFGPPLVIQRWYTDSEGTIGDKQGQFLHLAASFFKLCCGYGGSGDDVVVRRKAYGVPSIQVDGNDALAVYFAVLIEKKDASTSETPAINQSNEDYEYGVPTDAQNATYYNYRTHMKITPRMKWSKQDTELFYEAIQQFGTDLSMIKECFPGRTREQIKSKYKKEERQQPLRLNDALATRAKGGWLGEAPNGRFLLDYSALFTGHGSAGQTGQMVRVRNWVWSVT